MNRCEKVHLSVVAPACNEQEVIEQVLGTWVAFLREWGRTFEIVVTDDGSSDRTGEILEKLEQTIPELRLVRFPHNQGYGPAVAAAVKASRGILVATVDSDGQFELSEAAKLVERLESRGLDAVTGYRLGKKDAFIKVLADRVLNLLVNLICGVRFKDNNCALKVVRGDLLRQLPLNTRWLTPSEILVRLVWEGRAVEQMGVTHRQRTAGKSKIHVIAAMCVRLVGVMMYLRMELYLRRHGMLFPALRQKDKHADTEGPG